MGSLSAKNASEKFSRLGTFKGEWGYDCLGSWTARVGGFLSKLTVYWE